jgi:hypothetical protein
MGKHERQTYLKAIRSRYWRAGKMAKVTILDEFCAVCGYHRKYAIRLLNQRGKPRIKRMPGRKPIYGSPELLAALKRIWFASDQMCSKKLKVAIPLWLPFYGTLYKALTPETQDMLLTVSAATIDRLLKPVRVAHGRKGLSGTKPGTLLKNQIPIRTHFWDISQPGFMEADTVAHCGNSLAGDFVWSLTMTDIDTTWTENRATWNKGAEGVLAQIRDIETRLPFSLKGFDCDNGSEFLNYHLLRYFTDHPSVTSFTRSRPYKKNDNAHVEQKNWSHVRQLFGYDRFEDFSQVDLMNDLYANEWSLYQNHFCPNMKLLEKKRINSKYYKKYDSPRTPYDRVLASDHITNEVKECLEAVHQSLNPFILKRSIEKKLRVIFKSVKVTSNVRQRI